MSGSQNPFPFPGQVSPQAQAMLGMLIDSITAGVIHKLGATINPAQPVSVQFRNPDGSVGVTSTSIAQLLANVQIALQKTNALLERQNKALEQNSVWLDDLADMMEESNRLTASALNQANASQKARRRKKEREEA